MFVHFNMPSMEKWTPKNAILIWLNDKPRRDHVGLIEKDSAKQQRYFKGTFELASSTVDSEEEESMDESDEKNIKF